MTNMSLKEEDTAAEGKIAHKVEGQEERSLH